MCLDTILHIQKGQDLSERVQGFKQQWQIFWS